MNTKLIFIALIALAGVAGTAKAQDTLSSQNTSTSSAQTSSGASSVNQGVTAQVNQISTGEIHYSGHYSQTANAQVPISTVGYGSFSQNSCITSIGGGATTRMFSFVYNGPKADINCQHVVSGDAFGRASQLAMQNKVPGMALASLSMVFYQYCTADEATKQGCIAMGLVEATGQVKHIKGEDVAMVRPVKVLPEGARQMAAAMLGMPAIASTEPQAQPTLPTDAPRRDHDVNVPLPSQAIAGTWRGLETGTVLGTTH